MEIRLISSLTPEDEARYASTLVKVMAAMLEELPITYAIHVQLADGNVVDHSHGLRLLDKGSPSHPPGGHAGPSGSARKVSVG